MNITSLLPKRISNVLPQRNKRSGRMVVTYWDREHCYYLVVSFKPGHLELIRSGSLAHSEFPDPLVALSDHLKQQSISVQRLVVLLSRSELEVLSMELPPSAAAELPMMVASAVEEQLGETDTPPIVDFYQPTQPEGLQASNELSPILAYALPNSRMQYLRASSQQAGFRLVAVSTRQLPALSLLGTRVESHDALLVVSIQIYVGEIELALCYKNQPLLMRSVRVSLDDCQRAAEQLSLEVERCMSLLPPKVEELGRQWLIDLSHDSALPLAEALLQTTGCEVRTIQAELRSGRALLKDRFGLSAGQTVESTFQGSAQNSVLPATLVGAARSVAQESLDIDFVSPKRPPAPPKPWVRPALWGAGLTAAAAVVGGTLLSDVWSLQSQVGELERELAESRKLQAKFQEKSDQVQAVENWLRDQVDWLTALSEVSQRLPDGQNATVRRLTATVGEGIASFDLSVQVVQPEEIATLENRLRSVKYAVSSKRISQSPEASEYPWKFETRITFPIEPIQWNQYIDSLQEGQP